MKIRKSALALVLAALPFAGCTNPEAPQAAPAPGSARAADPSTDDTVTFNAETGIRMMRRGVVSPKCRRSTIFTVTHPCAGLTDLECKTAAERESMLRAKNGDNNLLKVTAEGCQAEGRRRKGVGPRRRSLRRTKNSTEAPDGAPMPVRGAAAGNPRPCSIGKKRSSFTSESVKFRGIGHHAG